MNVNKAILEGMVLEGVFSKIVDKSENNKTENNIGKIINELKKDKNFSVDDSDIKYFSDNDIIKAYRIKQFFDSWLKKSSIKSKCNIISYDINSIFVSIDSNSALIKQTMPEYDKLNKEMDSLMDKYESDDDNIYNKLDMLDKKINDIKDKGLELLKKIIIKDMEASKYDKLKSIKPGQAYEHGRNDTHEFWLNFSVKLDK